MLSGMIKPWCLDVLSHVGTRLQIGFLRRPGLLRTMTDAIEVGSPLNRLSWLRPAHSFLNAVVASPKTRWLVSNAGQQLVSIPSASPSSKPVIAQLTTEHVKPFLGPAPFFGQAKEEGQTLTAEEGTHFTESARHRGVRVVFLGLIDTLSTENALPTTDFTDPERAIAKLEGTPFFAVDVAESGLDNDLLLSVDKTQTLSWVEPRGLLMGLQLDKVSLSLFNGARSMVDWNQRNKFCPACGSPTYSVWAGWKINCSTLLPWADNTGRKPCPTSKGLHNFAHPRTDPVVITIAVDETGEKILLGRGKKYPGKMYSALAGFIEPGETFEEAVVREMWEEAGVKVSEVSYHSGQPWPFPANLMVGFYARADSAQPIRTDLDNELVDARWYTRAEVLTVLNHKLKEATEGPSDADSAALAKEEPAPPADDPPFRVPPTSAIAGVLIRDWAFGKTKFPVRVYGQSVQKGNL
ncbi:NUDIX hydrolase domain-like protein [Mycena amicta]|nr:NUDIX hydrolase domain-like protein [Mycena amicta]